MDSGFAVAQRAGMTVVLAARCLNSFARCRMGYQVEELARFVAETSVEDIPEKVRRHARLVLLDTLGVILAGSTRPEVAELRGRLAMTAGTGATVYASGWPEQDPR